MALGPQHEPILDCIFIAQICIDVYLSQTKTNRISTRLTLEWPKNGIWNSLPPLSLKRKKHVKWVRSLHTDGIETKSEC